MKIDYFRGSHPNFGDELNSWLWPKVLPNFFDGDDSVRFIGIGSTIGMSSETSARKIIFGAGFVPSYRWLSIDQAKSWVTGADWHVYFVRGPRSARWLNISPELALADSAILIRTVANFQNRFPEVISFIPHWESMERGNWEESCKLAGINLIDPRLPVDDVLRELLRSKVVIAEAMHGAIVSDALRIPWIPVVPIDIGHRDKWLDWADSLNITLRPHTLPPSNVREARMLISQTKIAGSLRNVLKRNRPGNSTDGASQPTGKGSAQNPKLEVLNRQFTELAANRLGSLSKISPSLSGDNQMERITQRMLDKVLRLQYDYQK